MCVVVVVVAAAEFDLQRRSLRLPNHTLGQLFAPIDPLRMWASIREAHKSVVQRDISLTQLCNEALKRVDETKHLNAFISTFRETALKEASRLDQRLQEQREQDLAIVGNPLFGKPISIKDNFCTKQALTTCGSRMLHNFVPPYTATAVLKLQEANCIMLGKTNMDEFAMGSSCTTSFYNPAANYFKRELLAGRQPNECDPSEWYMAGGSSTGSAISVASGSCFASLGTDTGGSTRQPASLTGVVGFKPTYGLISRFGLVPLAHCLDVVSLLARNVDDIEMIFKQVIGLDENDLTTVDHRTELKSVLNIKSERSLAPNSSKIRVGVPEEFVNKGELEDDVAKRYEEAINFLKNNTVDEVEFEIVKINLPNSNLATECYTIIASAEIASNMSCYDGVKYGLSLPIKGEARGFDRDSFFKANRDAGFGAEVKKRILLGNYFLMEANRDKYLGQALKLRRLISEDFMKTFEKDKINVILMPSTPTTSISYAEWLQKQDSNKLFREDYYLIPSNLANVPSISLPCGMSKRGLPIGLQLIASRFHDPDLLLLSKFFEQKIFKNLT